MGSLLFPVFKERECVELMNARFMPADALWTFAMACNVYLTFFRKYDASRLRSLEWKYAIMCYGVPFIPAFVYFFIKTDSKGPIYGSAVVSSNPSIA